MLRPRRLTSNDEPLIPSTSTSTSTSWQLWRRFLLATWSLLYAPSLPTATRLFSKAPLTPSPPAWFGSRKTPLLLLRLLLVLVLGV
jgi:hypothetical protein